MRIVIAILFLVQAIGIPTDSIGQVPDRFIGLWIVNATSTADAIRDDSNMAPQNKEGWTNRWFESGAELEIVESAITFRSPETGAMEILVISARDLEDHALLTATIQGPSAQNEMKLTIELRLSDSEEMNFKIQEENDFDLVIWQRSDDHSGESATQTLGTTIDYLDSLASCTKGEFRLNYTGLSSVINTILGQAGNDCRVRSERSNVRMVCDFSAETIALLTSENKYEEARAGILSGSTTSEESIRMETECRVE